MGWDRHHIKIVYFLEFRGLGFSCTGHAGKLFIHAKVVLKGD